MPKSGIFIAAALSAAIAAPALATQFSEVGKTCKACHDDFRAE